MIHNLLSESDKKLDQFIINKLEAECGTKLRYEDYKRLTLSTDIFGNCQTPGCEGAFFTKLALLYDDRTRCNQAGLMKCDMCKRGVGPYTAASQSSKN